MCQFAVNSTFHPGISTIYTNGYLCVNESKASHAFYLATGVLEMTTAILVP